MATTATTRYNGWANWETWAVNNWLTNDAASYGVLEQMIRQHREGNLTLYELGQTIKDAVEQDNPLVDQASMYADLLNAALSDVDWFEIAESHLSDRN